MSLPSPSAPALAHSQTLVQHIAEHIQHHSGWIPFADYMQLALYAAGRGYYSAGAAKLGAAGDFTTAPELSALFGYTLAQQVAQVLQASGGDVLEIGAGSGRLACDLLTELAALDCLPTHYYILEVSADLRARQHATLSGALPAWLDRVVWLDTLPDSFSGCMLGNEVLDAMPVHLVHWREAGLFERGVSWENDTFVWQDRPLAPGLLHDTASSLALAPNYISEINLAATGFIHSLAQRLSCGALVFIDYGFGEREFYHPQRSDGTLMCHYRHHAHPDPFYLPGLQDITAHVDFSAIAVAGIDAGLMLAGYTSQAQFLINCGITAILARTPAHDSGRYLPQVAAVQKLMSPAEMGELFKAIGFIKGIDIALLGFVQGDQSRRL